MTMKIVITGVKGLLGWHTAARLHAKNCDARFKNLKPPHELVLLDRESFQNARVLASSLENCDAIIHMAGVNRGTDEDIRDGNTNIAQQLVEGCNAAMVTPHILYANSIHCTNDSTYGISKMEAGDLLRSLGGLYTDIRLPHIFGECARPFYNNVTATLIDNIWEGISPQINPEGSVNLLHAGRAADLFISSCLSETSGVIEPAGEFICIQDLYDCIRGFHELYSKNIMPDVSDPFQLELFNSYRTGGYPRFYPKKLATSKDSRGVLFETTKAMGGGQTFVSSTLPDQVRGNHFHISLVERFIVVEGKATINLRKVLTNEVHSFEVDGNWPVAIDMPPLHTHNIVNEGDETVVTSFWAHRHFDPENSDTYADLV